MNANPLTSRQISGRRRTRATARILAVLAVGALALSACGDSDGDEVKPSGASDFAAGSTMAKLADAGKITIGTKFDQPGFGLKNLSGKPEGFDVEVAKIIAGKLGIDEDDITWKETPSAIREEVIEKGEVDLVAATYTINDKRKERITFAGPYYEAGQQLMVKSDNTKITGPDTLKANPDAKVCSVAGSTPAENIREYLASESQLVTFDVYSKCADALRNGQVSVVTTDNVILLGLVGQSKGAFKVVGDTFTKEPYGIGIKKGDTAFCTFINDTLKAAASDGSYEKAWTSTAGKVEGSEVPTLPTADPCA
ncbi:MAG TPA: glutamate ABC transporter substrate-binding protein [Kineosporiaceae bacterium]|nr:glutamate ABC transporter substrate-binding protein [Kineosporiaceae bacterium]